MEVYNSQVKIPSQHGNGDDFWHQPLRTSPHSLALLVALAKKDPKSFSSMVEKLPRMLVKSFFSENDL